MWMARPFMSSKRSRDYTLVVVLATTLGGVAIVSYPTPVASETGEVLERSLRKLAEARDDPYRWLAILKDLSLEPARGVPAYTGLLSDVREPVRRHALRALQAYGIAARPAAHTIVSLLDDISVSPETQVLAVNTLETIKPQQSTLIRALIDYLAASDSKAHVIVRVIPLLVLLRPEASVLKAQILPLLRHADLGVQFAAFRALGELASTGDDNRLLTGPKTANTLLEGGYRLFIQIRHAGAESSSWLPALVRLVQEDGTPAFVRVAAIETLAHIGRIDASAARALFNAVGAVDEFISQSATENLSHLDMGRPHLLTIASEGLRHDNPRVRRQAAVILKAMGPNAAPATEALCAALRRANGQTASFLIAAYLDALRTIGRAADSASETISDLLSYRSVIYADRDTLDVLRMRAYLLVVLSDIGAPESSYPYILDALAHVDEQLLAYEAAAAARVAGSIGPRARPFVPYLLRALGKRTAEEEFSLERFDPIFPREEATTFQIEAIRALVQIQPVDDPDVIHVLTKLSTASAPFAHLDSRLFSEARRALQMFADHGQGKTATGLAN
ncbi:MAG: hypothetical protein NPIRA02_13230 [Nitrospirales bacterium]|nr:MAG: hypothetical protein NPIRA02_13230 [Nitrospirales bacterium]